MNRRQRWVTLFSLYAVQGLVLALFSMALKNWLAERGLAPDRLGTFLVIVGLPTALKIVWGPVVDRWGRSPRGRWSWILAGQAGIAAAGLLAMVVTDPVAQLDLLGAILFLQVAATGLFDVAIDGMAVRTSPPEERARTNAVMFSGQAVGIVVGSVLFSRLLVSSGMPLTALVQAAMVAALAAVPLLHWRAAAITPDEADASPPASWRAIGRDLRVGLVGRSSVLLAGVFVLTSVGTHALGVMMSYAATSEWGWASEAYSSTTGALALVKVVGLILGAALADRIGHVRGFLICGTLLVAVDVATGLSVGLLAERSFLIGYLVVNQLLAGMAAVAVLALCMDLCHPRVAATQFTAYMALTNLSSLGGDWLGGQLTGTVALGVVFVVYAGAQVVWLGLVASGLDPEETKRRLEAA